MPRHLATTSWVPFKRQGFFLQFYIFIKPCLRWCRAIKQLYGKVVLNAREHKVAAEQTGRLLQLPTLAADPHGLTLSPFPQLSTCFSPLSCIQLMFSGSRTETTRTSLQESHHSVFPLIIPEGTAVTVIRWWALLPLAQSPLRERGAACVCLWVWGSFTSVFVGTKVPS